MENKPVTPAAQALAPAVSEIRALLETSRKNIAQQVNQELLSTYWKIGEVIVRYEQNDSVRAAYGEKTLLQLSKALTKELGKGFSRSNVYNMRQFYLSYPIFQTVSGKLNWSHYCELLSISDKKKRSFYEKEAVNAGWSVREMKRQIDSSLFERLLLSRGDANKEQVLALAEKGVDYAKPEDIIKDPYVFEFLGLPEEKPFLESDLEAALVRQIEDFLLELGRGFMFGRHTAAGHCEQHPLLCGHGVLQQDFARLCADRVENHQTHARSCRADQYVSELLCRRGQRPGRQSAHRHHPLHR